HATTGRATGCACAVDGALALAPGGLAPVSPNRDGDDATLSATTAATRHGGAAGARDRRAELEARGDAGDNERGRGGQTGGAAVVHGHRAQPSAAPQRTDDEVCVAVAVAVAREGDRPAEHVAGRDALVGPVRRGHQACRAAQEYRRRPGVEPAAG